MALRTKGPLHPPGRLTWWLSSPWFTEIEDRTDKRQQQKKYCASDQPERGLIVSHSVGLALKTAGSQQTKLGSAERLQGRRLPSDGIAMSAMGRKRTRCKCLQGVES